ncbi:hypothetical protein ACM614_02330 [Streptomyces sp. 12297]|uniref:hypothetical protein n=1 Tax=Streptomyces sp. NBC_00239 TaxID=2903640 RepID=UPI002E2CDAE4|nr:hypothetical protein [Streptomyces sp. NBC_00239]
MGMDWAVPAAIFFLSFSLTVTLITVLAVAVRLRRRDRGPLAPPAPSALRPYASHSSHP